MKNLVFAAFTLGTFAAALPAPAQVQYVDPTIGGVGFLLEPTRPTVHLPNSMVRVYPVRKDQLDDRISSFPLTIISHRLGELFFLMPGNSDRPAAYDQEVTTPYYYATRFDESLIRTEFSPAERSGYFRFSFPDGQACLWLANRFPGELKADGSQAVTGIEKFNGMQAFVYGEFNLPVEVQSKVASSKTHLTVKTTQPANSLEFRYGISLISSEQAKLNLKKEIPDWNFDRLKSNARQRWNAALGRIQVDGGSESQRRVFYTALYRCFERMVNITEDGRYYSAFDHQVHTDPRPFYVDNWLWDTFRALEPLQTLLNPEQQADKIQSYVRMYEQTGWMPSFAVLWGDYACMNGNHAAGWMADAWFKGVRNFDLKTAYAGLRKNSLEGTLLPWRNGPKCALDDFYNEHGYFPSLPPGAPETEPLVHPFENRQSVAVTLENSYDDWCIAQLARSLNLRADEELFLKRAANYKNVFRADKALMWPKDAQGKWIEPFDPKFDGGMGGRAYFDENNAYTYTWDVVQDYAGLFELMGGLKSAEANLDRLFREGIDRSKYEFWAKFPDSSAMIGQFSMGNEPSLPIPYLYNRAGVPWKTQKRIRQVLDAWFNDTIHGIPGDEDGGGMCSFVVFSMMGFYPVTPGIPAYDLGSPVFDKVQIRLGNGKQFNVVSRHNSRDNKYIQAVRLNGRPWNQVWFRHADIANGGKLELDMGNTPNVRLGADPATLPPASLSVRPEDLATPGI